jgi:CarD family transcriptional regulator
MTFVVGDKVVHPSIGAGTVTGTKEQELIAGFKHYYVIDIPAWESTVYVPVRKADELGLRSVLSREKIAGVLDILAGRPRPLPGDHRERQEAIEARMATGLPLEVAEAVRDLAWHKSAARLNQKDEQLMAHGRKLLASEIAVVLEIGVEEAYGAMDRALELAIAQGVEKS